MCFKLVGPYCCETFACNCSQDKCLCSKITAIIIIVSSCASKWAFRREMGFFHVSIIFIHIKKSWEKWFCSTSTQVTSGKWSRNNPSISPSLSATYKCLHSYLHLKCFICQLQCGICKCRLVTGALLAAASSSFQMWLLLDISCPDL